MITRNASTRCINEIRKQSVQNSLFHRTIQQTVITTSEFLNTKPIPNDSILSPSAAKLHTLSFSNTANAQFSRSNSTFAAASSGNSQQHNGNDGDYVSPFKDFFEMIHNNEISSGKDADDYSKLPVKTLRCGVPETALKFKTHAYGRTARPPYVMPHEHKVIMTVNLKHLPFENETEKEIFFQIVGPRFDKSTNELKLISNQFASRIENKRHAVSMLERIMENSKTLAKDVISERETI